MSIPTVTVVMAAHNAGKYIRHAIDSLLRQTLHDFELIVVDDASTDGSLDIVRSYSDPRIHIIENGIQKGPSYARNRGLEQARGEYIAILDADDIALPDRLRIQSEYLNSAPDVCLAGSNFETIDEEGAVTCRDRIRRDSLTLRWLLLFGNCLVHSTGMFRAKAIKSLGGYNNAMLSGEDYDLYVRFAAHGRVALLDDVLCQWRVHREGLSRQEPHDNQNRLWAQSVCRSVFLQTSQTIDEDVALCLMRNIGLPASDRHTVLRAFEVITSCLESLYESRVDKAELRLLLLLAIEELLRVAKLNPGARRAAFGEVARLLSKYDPILALHWATTKILLRGALPSGVTTTISQVKSRKRVSANDVASLV